jgi:hypothetical protein
MAALPHTMASIVGSENDYHRNHSGMVANTPGVEAVPKIEAPVCWTNYL